MFERSRLVHKLRECRVKFSVLNVESQNFGSTNMVKIYPFVWDVQNQDSLSHVIRLNNRNPNIIKHKFT